MPDVVMPRLSDSMEEGTILKWLVEPGVEVTRGQEIVEIETDKATMTYEADAAGVLQPVAAEGDTLPIGAVIATIGGASVPAAIGGAPASAKPAAAAAPASPAAAPVVERPAAAPAPATALAPPPPTEAALIATEPGARVKASPLARRLARENGLDVAALSGSGPGGRIVKADVEAAASGAAPASAAASAPASTATTATTASALAPAASPAPTQAGGNRGDTTVVEPTRTQSLIARRMAEAKATIPEFTLTTEIDMEAAVALRAELKKALGEDGPAPSYNDMVVKASALALREFPKANGSYKDGKFELYGRINVGIAVAAQDALVVPTVFDADTRSLGDIARTTRALAERVRTNEVTPPELSGGTFTVSNLGMYGVAHFTAVINPPQAAILAVGAMVAQPVVRDGEIVVRNVMPVTLACDHRILYGADAAEFLARIRKLLERPVALLL